MKKGQIQGISVLKKIFAMKQEACRKVVERAFGVLQLIGHRFYPLLAMVYNCFNIYLLRYSLFRVFTGSWTIWRNVVILVSLRAF